VVVINDFENKQMGHNQQSDGGTQAQHAKGFKNRWKYSASSAAATTRAHSFVPFFLI